MTTKLRIHYSNTMDPYYNLALEEYLLHSVESDEVILYLWQNDNTVVIGRNQNPWAECALSKMEEDGVNLTRRLSGGGAVFHDWGNLNFTFLCHKENYDLQKQLQVIREAVAMAGICAEFSGRNDLLADGRKFSGNAFYESKGRCYHHGTLLIHSQLDRLQNYLTPSKAKLESKGVVSVRSRVVNLQELSPNLTCGGMRQYMAEAFTAVYGLPREKSPKEDHKIVLALREHYTDPNWLYGKTLPFSCSMHKRFSWGQIELRLQVTEGRILHLQVFTDAMDSAISEEITAALQNCVFSKDAMLQKLMPLTYGEDLCKLISEQM